MERFLPYLVILLCPLLHIFMLRGMHGKKPWRGLGVYI